MSRVFKVLAFVACVTVATACTIQLGGDDDDDGRPRNGPFGCPGCEDAGTPDGYPDGGSPWWGTDAGPWVDPDAGCGDGDGGSGGGYPDAGWEYTQDAGSADW